MPYVVDVTMIISLLQPGPEPSELFDDIGLLSEAEVTYWGPRENILELFGNMGFKSPEREGFAWVSASLYPKLISSLGNPQLERPFSSSEACCWQTTGLVSDSSPREKDTQPRFSFSVWVFLISVGFLIFKYFQYVHRIYNFIRVETFGDGWLPEIVGEAIHGNRIDRQWNKNLMSKCRNTLVSTFRW